MSRTVKCDICGVEVDARPPRDGEAPLEIDVYDFRQIALITPEYTGDSDAGTTEILADVCGPCAEKEWRRFNQQPDDDRDLSDEAEQSILDDAALREPDPDA